MGEIHSGWYKTHRPTSLDKYIFQNEEVEKAFYKYVEQGDMPDILLSGHRGTGKTTLGLILKNAMGISDIDFLKLNASDDNSVDDIRHIIKPFINQLSVGKWRLVFFDEADSLTPQAQDALKSMMEDEYRNARFIFTCNKPHKLTPELRSRCTEYEFTALNKTKMKEMGIDILLDHGMIIDNDNMSQIFEVLDEHLSITYPDLRQFITSLERHFSDGILSSPSYTEKELEFLAEFLVCVDNNAWTEIRDIIYGELPTDEIGNIYRFLDRNLHEINKFSSNEELRSKGYLVLAQHASEHEKVAIPELNLTACMIKLCRL